MRLSEAPGRFECGNVTANPLRKTGVSRGTSTRVTLSEAHRQRRSAGQRRDGEKRLLSHDQPEATGEDLALHGANRTDPLPARFSRGAFVSPGSAQAPRASMPAPSATGCPAIATTGR